ncbi:MAG: Rrf2 family transcriptional regulator [Lachnospiraceae bacterium]|nr:Rrf2 family transcriptional regulator [Lachnospiraceae bacterium]
MLVSTKGRYALRTMIDLAEHSCTGEDISGYRFVPLTEVATRQEISEKYLESIVKLLVTAKFLEGVRGKGGGYRLTRKPEAYTVGEILRLTELSLAPVACLSEEVNTCERAPQCRTLPMWKGLADLVNEYFDGITLKELSKEDV